MLRKLIYKWFKTINMIQYEEKVSSSVLPYSEPKTSVDINAINEQFKKALLQKDTSLIEIYNKFFIKNSSTVLKSILQNTEQLIKEKNLQDDNSQLIISSIFSTIYTQLKILETLNIKKPTNDELVSLVTANTFSCLKRLLS